MPKSTFDTVAIPKLILQQINAGEKSRADFLCNWRLSYPVPPHEPQFTRAVSSQLSIIEKILNRGRLTLLSGELESEILRLCRDRNCHKPATLAAIQLAHQLQLALVTLYKKGIIANPITIAIPPCSPKIIKKYQKLAALALRDLRRLDRAIASLYELSPLFAGSRLELTTSQSSVTAAISTSLPFSPLRHNFCRHTIMLDAKSDPASEVKFLLNYIFRFPDFRPSQIDGILRYLQGEDTISLLPTGSGKSIIYQLLALIRPGCGVIVDPIISLIDDQVDNLQRSGIDRIVGISATTDDKAQAMLDLSAGCTLMAYVAPERFQIDAFRDRLAAYATDSVFSVLAIDEAHCVSEWGHDFRTSYLNLAPAMRALSHNQPLIALTGTASGSVLHEMTTDLQIPVTSVTRPATFDRPELNFDVVPAKSAAKPQALARILAELLPTKFHQTPSEFYRLHADQTMCGIIFCAHVSGEYGVTEVIRILKSLGLSATEYYGQQSRATKSSTDDAWAVQKQLNATQFKNNEIPLLVATKSFGMGVDKPNIRYTIHYGLPSSVEEYYQEAGRAGRDRASAWSYVILSNDFHSRNDKLLNPETTELHGVGQILKASKSRDDIDRLLFFHLNSFPGIEAELATTQKVLRQLGDLSYPHLVNLHPTALDAGSCEKSLHRLQTLGVIRDYTVNFASGEFCCAITGLDPARLTILPDDLRALLAETYATVEPSRRRAIGALVDIMSVAAKLDSSSARNAHIRREILRYLKLD